MLEKRGYAFDRVHTRRAVLEKLDAGSPDLIIVDARALRFDAQRLCQTIRANDNQVPFLLILPETETFTGSCATLVLQGRITSRRVLNRVKRLLSKPGADILRVGDIVLDIKQRTVTRADLHHRLTPKQACLLEILMRNPGRVLTRAFLMKEVWNTNFVDDTRTLEVHIHWLRKAIEDDPSHPVYLSTVRCLGYRFDVPKTAPQP